MKIYICLAIALLVSLGVSARSVLSIQSSTMSAGGTIQIPITLQKGQEAQVGLTIAPTLEYFLTRTFALGIAPSAIKQVLTLGQSPWFLGMGLTGTYYFDLRGALYPYLGVLAGVGYQTQQELMLFQLGFPIGILVALNNHVALKMGVPIALNFSTKGFLGAELPIGYIGVQAFF
jgi:outer membrane protein W